MRSAEIAEDRRRFFLGERPIPWWWSSALFPASLSALILSLTGPHILCLSFGSLTLSFPGITSHLLKSEILKIKGSALIYRPPQDEKPTRRCSKSCAGATTSRPATNFLFSLSLDPKTHPHYRLSNVLFRAHGWSEETRLSIDLFIECATSLESRLPFSPSTITSLLFCVRRWTRSSKNSCRKRSVLELPLMSARLIFSLKDSARTPC